jgi:hypothetical protein
MWNCATNDFLLLSAAGLCSLNTQDSGDIWARVPSSSSLHDLPELRVFLIMPIIIPDVRGERSSSPHPDGAQFRKARVQRQSVQLFIQADSVDHQVPVVHYPEMS